MAKPLAAAGLMISIASIAVGADERSAAQADVHESLIRQAFVRGCTPDTHCFVAVDGKPPSHALAERIRDLPYVRPLPDGYAGSGLIFDIGPVNFVSSTSVEVHGQVRGHQGPVFTWCAYFLHRVKDRWQLDEGRTQCAVA